ncbi:MAG: ribonuclease domain-containing protein [Burkholderiaceae bacterium]
MKKDVSSVKLVLTGLLLGVSLLLGQVQAKGPIAPSHSATISVAQMPLEGARVYDLISVGGPFPYEKDGAVFANRERLLPVKSRGYYREYTVSTPGARYRATRRIVCGGQPRAPEACYFSADHYASFRRIVP